MSPVRSIDQKVSCVIVGNKTDLEARRVVSYEEGRALGKNVIIKPTSINCRFAKLVQRQIITSNNYLKILQDRLFSVEQGVNQQEKDLLFRLNKLVTKMNIVNVAKADKYAVILSLLWLTIIQKSYFIDSDSFL